MVSDPNQQPHTEGGCDQCLGAVTIAPNDEVVRNPAYYVIAHAAKWVRPGSVRIASNVPDQLPNVAFRTTAGKKVLVVLNESQTSQTFTIRFTGKAIVATLPAGAVATYVLE